MSFRHDVDKVDRLHGMFVATAIALLCVALLAGCDAPPPQTSRSAHAVNPTAPADAAVQPDMAHLRSPFAPTSAGSAAASAGGRNFDALLTRYPATERTRITGWYATHAAGSMSFTSNAQWQWMRQHGYPTPDDVLRAATMSDAQLRELAVRGDTVANFFYLGRLLDEATKTDSPKIPSGRAQSRLREELTFSMDRALATGSAFAGYMFDGYYAALHGTDIAGAGKAAGLIWALSLGDTRAEFTQQVTMGFPGASGVRAAETYFDMFAAAARVNPYFLNARRGKGELSIPLQ